MDKRLLLLVLSAVVPSSAALFAQARPGASRIDPRAPIAAIQSAPPATTTVSLRGTIGQYDAQTRTLSLATAHGAIRLVLPTSIRIRSGWHRVDVADLWKLAGDRATVRYTEAGGITTVESVHVFGK